MLKKVLWIAAAAAAVLVALAVSRNLEFDRPAAKAPAEEAVAPTAPEAADVATPAVAVAPAEPAAIEAAPPPTPEDVQVQEDAAATGMTTLEPADGEPPT